MILLNHYAAFPAKHPFQHLTDCRRLLLAPISLFPPNLADRSDLKATYLLDPIDVTSYAPVSPDFPSAAAALAASGKPAGITGAGVLSSCNPTSGNYAVLFKAAGEGSWQIFLPGASHSQFSDGGPLINSVQDLLCGKGADSRKQVNELAATPMLAWFWHRLRGANAAAQDSQMDGFYAWVQRKEAAGLLQFKVKQAAGGQAAGPPLTTFATSAA